MDSDIDTIDTDASKGTNEERESLKPIKGAQRRHRRRLDLRHEIVLALLPTVTILIVLGLVEVLSRQRLLFGSLAASAFLIYLDPEHGTNTVRTLITSHVIAAGAGLLGFWLFGSAYIAGGVAMVTTIFLMLVLDAVHPPAIATSLAYAFRAHSEETVIVFFLALGIIAVLVMLERLTLRLMAHFAKAGGKRI